MNYQNIYDRIIERARTRILVGIYCEKHHIKPKCIGGSNSKENLVNLTAREHFLCHWLLLRIYPQETKMANAFWLMCRMKRPGQLRYIPSSRAYKEAKESLKGRVQSEETKEKIRIGNQGKVVSQETRNLLSKIHLGKPKSKEAIEKNRLYHTGKVISEETKEKMSLAKKGKTKSPETRERMKQAQKLRRQNVSTTK